MDIAVLIPAYKPSKKLIPFVRSLAKRQMRKIIIVDDGGGVEYSHIFDELRGIDKVIILSHDTNNGKGAALKTGFKFMREKMQGYKGVVTADADGQHREEDIVAVAEALIRHPEALILGARDFSGKVPLRSKIGNKLTIGIFRLFFRIKISDTQTGLRGIQHSMIPIFSDIPFNRYEYEAEMLLLSSRHGITIKEVRIETVYEDNNSSSHFNPLLDSLKIYFVLLRYTMASIISAVVDFLVFIAIYPWLGNILLSTYAARSVSLCVNYGLVSRKVFFSSEKMRKTFPKYLLLVIVSGAASSLFIYCLHRYTAMPINLAKILAESILYIVNFFVQKRFIFKEHKPIFSK